MKLSEENFPLILVMYLDRDMMTNKPLIKAFSDNLNKIIEQKDANIITLFMPTDGEEKVECVNPRTIDVEGNDELIKMLSEIKSNFGF